MSNDIDYEKPSASREDDSKDYERDGGADSVNLNQNVEAKIKNPLAGLSREALFADVDRFATENDLEDINDDLRKGALVAQDPGNYEQVVELDDAERQALKDEAEHIYKQPMSLYISIIVCSIGAAVQGWDQTGSNGANLSFPKEFGIWVDPDNPSPDDDKNQWILGLVNSAPYIGSAFIGCWLSDPLNNLFGRRGTIFFSANFCLWPAIGSGFTKNWYELFICRILLGIGMGSKGSTVPVFAAENSPAAIRGSLVMTWVPIMDGIWGTCANLAVVDTGKIAWRLQLGSAFIPAVPLLLGIYFCPESPRWYIKKRRYKEAFKSLLRLRNHRIQAARDLYYINAQISVEHKVMGQSTYLSRFIDLFRVPRIRRATLAAGIVMLAQQMCGINIMAFYSSSIFEAAGASPKESLIASMGFGLINFLFAWPAVFTIDTYGPHIALIALFVYIFTAFYSAGEGPVPFAYSAEVFPLSHREVGMSYAVTVCLFFAAVLAMTWPRMLGAMTPTGAFGFYAALNIVAFFLIFCFLPETKQRTLEELDYIFGVPTHKFTKYQWTQALPYWIKKNIMRKKDVELKSLYQFDESVLSSVEHRRKESQARRRSSTASAARKQSTTKGSEFVDSRNAGVGGSGGGAA
ncbi:hypothetical protein TWF679_000272 [Orbilia oligospora]|uniref:Major facilitator superfamily (MFS) profile domain-containing protein n=1 Tax=Orbilia oligospora TaxID=2813651 RepID=A0A8H8VNJ9_ORBOL|nr:hypothetical protein TWF679_000272 [Orbilia oligospora]